MSETAMALARRNRRWPAWGVAGALVLAGALAILWFMTAPPDRPVTEYRMLVPTDIPTAIDIAPTGDVWFTIDFSDAIGLLRNGQIHRIPKDGPNLEPLGLAADASGGAWYTNAAMKAISHVEPDGGLRSFPLATPIVRLGRMTLAPDGAVWFTDLLTRSVVRFKDGGFTWHSATDGGIPYGVAIAPDGTVWTTLQETDKLGRLSPNGELTTYSIPTGNAGVGDIAIDPSGAVWFLEIRANKIGRFKNGAFTEFPIPTTSAGLTGIAAAADGSIWFTELTAGKIGAICNDRVTEVRLPRESSRPFAMAADRGKTVWYTDLRGWVGKIESRCSERR